jgi:hypothetical protein
MRTWIHGSKPPPEGHPEEMRKAMSNDERALGSMLEDLSQADDGLLKEVNELVPATEVGRRARRFPP